MVYFGTRLSENISCREPEGYLICLNVPVARTGTQEYLPEELGLPPDSRLIPVYRPEEEVFDPACIASFEGMPVTDDHPSFAEGVTAENIRYLQKGHAHNIRRGEGKEADLLLADLIITDPGLIEEIMAGKREISCGYNYVLCEEDGRYVQREIRGNHVAVVEAGRAGPRVSIRDHERKALRRTGLPGKSGRSNERRMQMKQNRGSYGSNGVRRGRSGMASALRTARGALSAQRVARLMAMMARDGETEELAEMIAEIVEPAEALRTDTPPEQLMPAVPDNGIAEAVEEIITGDEEEQLLTGVPVSVAPVAPVAPVAAVPVAGAAAMPGAAVPAAVPVSAVPAPAGVNAVTAPAAAPGAPVALAVPENHEITIDCGGEVLSLLRRIVALLSPGTDSEEELSGNGADECGTDPTQDEDPTGAVEAVVEAVTQAVEAAEGNPAVPDEDPIEALVAEAVEGAVGGPAGLKAPGSSIDLEGAADPSAAASAAIGAAIGSALADPLTGAMTQDPLGLSGDEEILPQVLDPENQDCDVPTARTADAVRAAMATFRPILRNMAPAARRQAVAKIAANIRARDRRRTAGRAANGTRDTYARLKGASRRRPVADPTGLGKKIMASRNPNYKG